MTTMKILSRALVAPGTLDSPWHWWPLDSTATDSRPTKNRHEGHNHASVNSLLIEEYCCTSLVLNDIRDGHICGCVTDREIKAADRIFNGANVVILLGPCGYLLGQCGYLLGPPERIPLLDPFSPCFL
jgi:hypothetical protein